MFQTPISRLRAIGLIEGISFLILLGIAMPLKYFAGLPLAVTIVGWIHGVLFVAYLTLAALAGFAVRWSLWQWAIVFGASVVPLATFFLDARLRDFEPAESKPIH